MLATLKTGKSLKLLNRPSDLGNYGATIGTIQSKYHCNIYQMYETTVILKIALDVLNLTYGLKNNKKNTVQVVHSRAWTPKF